MVEGKLSTLLSNIGYNANTWIRPSNLHYIMVESDANQFYNPKLQKIYFDTTNELIKIKYSELKPITAYLKPFNYDTTANKLYFGSIVNSIYYRKTIREPKAGDIICCYSPSTKETTRSVIKKININQNNTIIELLDDDILVSIKNATSGLRFYIWLQDYTEGITLGTPCEYYTATEASDYDADIYISTDRVVGFDFNTNKWGI